MIGKVTVAATVLIATVAAGRAVDPRQLYNEMYPVNTLKRDAFNLCHQSDPTFIRALEDDRETCYDRMPHSFALAIGRVQPGSPLSGLFSPEVRVPGAALLPEAGLYSWAAAPQPATLHRGYFARAAGPCDTPPPPSAAATLRAAQALDALNGRSGQSTGAALVELGLLPRDLGPGGRPRPPIPPRPGVAGPPALAEPAGLATDQPGTIAPLDTAAGGNLGDDPGAQAAAGCRDRI